MEDDKKYLNESEVRKLTDTSFKLALGKIEIDKLKIENELLKQRKENYILAAQKLQMEIENKIQDIRTKKEALKDKFDSSIEFKQALLKKYKIKGSELAYDDETGEIILGD